MIFDTVAMAALAERDEELMDIARGASIIHLPIIALGEYRFGIERSRHREKLTRWFSTVIDLHEVLYVDLETLDSYAKIRSELKEAGTPIPANDIWIASLALQYGLRVVSRDTHFDKVRGIQRISW